MTNTSRRPSVLLLIADQLRGRDLHCTGNESVATPHIDALAARGVVAERCYANAPVCCPSRATIFSGRYSMQHRVIDNDLPIPDDVPFFAQPLRDAGYHTGYIGKWHLDGMPRSKFTPPGPRRHGFDFWAAYNCHHDYFNPRYYRDTDELVTAEGYEPVVQTDLAVDFLNTLPADDPFCLVLTWGPPHDPYDQVPEEFRAHYREHRPTLPANTDTTIPDIEDIYADYLAAITALDTEMGRLTAALDELGRLDDTIIVVTSDHGDMLGAGGWTKKQLPCEEAVHVPFVVSWPSGLPAGERRDGLLSTVDVAATLLDLTGVPAGFATDGTGRADLLRDGAPGAEEVYLEGLTRFDESVAAGKPEWRGIRTTRWTYAEAVGRLPWLLFDNDADPLQERNLVADPGHADVRSDLAARIEEHLHRTGDPFVPTASMVELLGLTELWEIREREMGAIP
ncbi:MAG: sulfatase-like hydrolase/transferase [Streptosporangiales bacterium]|nr:sulfatase-like hydrolase/transferase [Streptosporangiales bacterium]